MLPLCLDWGGVMLQLCLDWGGGVYVTTLVSHIISDFWCTCTIIIQKKCKYWKTNWRLSIDLWEIKYTIMIKSYNLCHLFIKTDEKKFPSFMFSGTHCHKNCSGKVKLVYSMNPFAFRFTFTIIDLTIDYVEQY